MKPIDAVLLGVPVKTGPWIGMGSKVGPWIGMTGVGTIGGPNAPGPPIVIGKLSILSFGFADHKALNL